MLSLRICLSILAALGVLATSDPAESAAPGEASLALTPAGEARTAMRNFSKALPDVEAYLRDAPVGDSAQRVMSEARQEFSLARLYAYSGQWVRCAQSARVAKSRLDDAVLAGRVAESQQRALEVALGDLTDTMGRASRALNQSNFDPLAASTLALAEQRRLDIAQLSADGRLHAARWAAADARDLSLLAIAQASDVTSAYALAREAAW